MLVFVLLRTFPDNLEPKTFTELVMSKSIYVLRVFALAVVALGFAWAYGSGMTRFLEKPTISAGTTCSNLN